MEHSLEIEHAELAEGHEREGERCGAVRADGIAAARARRRQSEHAALITVGGSTARKGVDGRVYGMAQMGAYSGRRGTATTWTT